MTLLISLQHRNCCLKEEAYMLDQDEHSILNDAGRIARRDEWFSRMSDLFCGRPNDYNRSKVFTLYGFVPRPQDADLAYTDPERWVEACLSLAAALPECTDDRFAPLCVEYPIFGVHFIDRILGARVFFKDGQWNADYLKTPVGELRAPDLETDETWALARRAALAFLDADVKLPLFGMPTLSSALNILVNLYGEEALYAMVDDEEAAAHDLEVINTLIRTLHRWYRENIPAQQLQPVISWIRTQPPEFGQLCGCTTHLLSGAMYEEMVAPLDDALLGDYPNGGMIHLCGRHTQHISTFRKMKHLRALQLNDRAAADLKAYLDGLRDDQIIYLNPCREMSTEEAIRISGGERIVLCESVDAPLKPLER